MKIRRAMPETHRRENERGVFSRRQVLVAGGALAGTLCLLDQLDRLAWVPQRVALTADASRSLPDIQFNIGAFMPAAQTIDNVLVSMPPIHTVFLTASLARAPSLSDQNRMESALETIESAYPFAPSGVFTHVAYSDNYFARFPSGLVREVMPVTLSGNQPVLRRAVAGPTDVAPGAHVMTLRRPEFNVPLVLEKNDILFTVRSDNSSFAGDVVAWLSGSNTLKGNAVSSPTFHAGMTITSSRAEFVQIGLPRNIAASNQLPFASFVNPGSPMWMGFADQQVNASAPAADVTFAGGDGIHLSSAESGDYFDNASMQHLSHVLMDLQQFYVDGNDEDVPGADHREPFSERVQYMFTSPPQLQENPADPYTNGGGPTNLGERGAFTQNVFGGTGRAKQNAVQFDRVGHLDGLQRSSRTSDGRPIHIRIDGPGFDAMDTTTGKNTAKLQFSGFFPSSDFFSTMRTNQACIDLLTQFNLPEDDQGLERFSTATRRQNFLIPPRRHRAFPIVELD
jgi:hypothetical protein